MGNRNSLMSLLRYSSSSSASSASTTSSGRRRTSAARRAEPRGPVMPSQSGLSLVSESRFRRKNLQNERCPIDQTNFTLQEAKDKKILKLDCGHHMHLKCYQEYVLRQGNSCPLDRRELSHADRTMAHQGRH